MTTIKEPSYVRLLCILSGIFFLAHIPFIAMTPLWGSSEAREAQVVWTMPATGEWILPLRNGIIPSKPPLFHWIGAAISTILGSTPLFAARFISLCAATGIIFLSLRTVIVFTSVSNSKLNLRRTLISCWAVLASSFLFATHAGDAKVDMFFSFWVMAAVAGYLTQIARGENGENELDRVAQAHAVLWYCSAGAVLTKGPLGFALPIFLAFAARCYLNSFRQAFIEFTKLRIPMIVAILIPVLWYVAAYAKGGGAFLDRHLIFENIQRITGGENMNTEKWWFYMPSILRTLFPWSLLTIALACYAWRSKNFHRYELVGLIIFLVGACIFSIPAGKRHSYILPLVPWMAISSALLFERFGWTHWLINSRKRVKIVESICICLLILFLGVVVNPHILLHLNYDPQILIAVGAIERLQMPVQWVFIGLIAGILAVNLKFSNREEAIQFISIWTTVLFLLLAPYYTGLMIKGDLKGFNRIALDIQKQTGIQQLTVIKEPQDEYFDPLFYYFFKQTQIANAYLEKGGLYLIKAEELSKEYDSRIEIIARYGETPKRFSQAAKRELILFRGATTR